MGYVDLWVGLGWVQLKKLVFFIHTLLVYLLNTS